MLLSNEGLDGLVEYFRGGMSGSLQQKEFLKIRMLIVCIGDNC